MALQQVTSDMLAAGAAVANIGTGGITSNEILDGTITKSDLANPLTQGTAQNSTSGTSIDFTGIPSWVKRITVMFNGVSTNGTSIIQIQVGSGSVTTSGYSGSASFTGATSGATTLTTGIGCGANVSAAYAKYGSMVLTNVNANIWTGFYVGGITGAAETGIGGGSISLAGTLDRVRITTVNGTDTFDAGSINIMYE